MKRVATAILASSMMCGLSTASFAQAGNAAGQGGLPSVPTPGSYRVPPGSLTAPGQPPTTYRETPGPGYPNQLGCSQGPPDQSGRDQRNCDRR